MKMDENGTWQPDCPSGDILARPEDRGEASFPVKFLLPHQCPKGARLAAYHALKYATVAVTTSLMNLMFTCPGEPLYLEFLHSFKTLKGKR